MELLPLPVGMVTKADTASTTIQRSGVYKTQLDAVKCEIGRNVYTNGRGQLLCGEMFGQNIDPYYTITTVDDQGFEEVVVQTNRIGFVAASGQILLEINQ